MHVLVVVNLVWLVTAVFVKSFSIDLSQQQHHSKTFPAAMVQQEQNNKKKEEVAFSHFHLYVDRLEELCAYKELEDKLNKFSVAVAEEEESKNIEQKQQIWKSVTSTTDEETSAPSLLPSPFVPFTPHGRDVVKQLLAGLGFRITAARYHPGTTGTRSVLVTSRDPQGVQILVTAKDTQPEELTNPHLEARGEEADGVRIFDADNLDVFYNAHAQRQGIAVLGFLVGDLDSIRNRYKSLHPNLVAHDYMTILEVYAFYQKDDKRNADKGTILRFVQQRDGNDEKASLVLPGLVPVPATFEGSSRAAYCDHWVSNVFSRTDFLDILADTLGFSIKVDFNAGTVAAGEAQIESTVTGNDSQLRTDDKAVALRDQSQVYLPINNALSSVGHVNGFLQELGQGIQHLASRVDDLVEFVQRGNDYRQITGEGFTFLRIPRSYYGILTASQLQEGMAGTQEGKANGVSPECATAIIAALKSKAALAKDGSVDLELTRNEIDAILDSGLVKEPLEEYRGAKATVLDVIVRSRYKNLYSLLGEHLSEESYLAIVRNQILVDVQGEDLLYQIFTANILQRKPGDEAPFFEYIQRVCSECLDQNGCPEKVRPGCGGFGIRNFLTLFLSIEVSKAMQEVSDAEDAGDNERAKYAQSMVDYFTEQLNESNPILTEISNAMTEEGRCKERMTGFIASDDLQEASTWKENMEAAADRKLKGNEKLMACSARYNAMMKSLREERARKAA